MDNFHFHEGDKVRVSLPGKTKTTSATVVKIEAAHDGSPYVVVIVKGKPRFIHPSAVKK